MGGLASKLESIFKAFEDQPVRVLMLGLDAAGKDDCTGSAIVVLLRRWRE